MSLNLSIPQQGLLVRMITTLTGDVVPQLTDTDGIPLPGQRRVMLDYAVDGTAEVTVTFMVDGAEIRLLPDCKNANLA